MCCSLEFDNSMMPSDLHGRSITVTVSTLVPHTPEMWNAHKIDRWHAPEGSCPPVQLSSADHRRGWLVIQGLSLHVYYKCRVDLYVSAIHGAVIKRCSSQSRCPPAAAAYVGGRRRCMRSLLATLQLAMAPRRHTARCGIFSSVAVTKGM